MDMNQALGAGFRLGFSGLLHMDVFSQRLDQEFDAPVVLTSPSVAYKVKIKGQKNIKMFGGDMVYVRSAFKLPDRSIIERVDEPMIKVGGSTLYPFKIVFRFTCIHLWTGDHHAAEQVHRTAGRSDPRAERHKAGDQIHRPEQRADDQSVPAERGDHRLSGHPEAHDLRVRVVRLRGGRLAAGRRGGADLYHKQRAAGRADHHCAEEPFEGPGPAVLSADQEEPEAAGELSLASNNPTMRN